MQKVFGLIGLSFTDSNKGCEALTYTFLSMITNIYKKDDVRFVCFAGNTDLGEIPAFFPGYQFDAIQLDIYKPSSWVNAYKQIKRCDGVFDGSYGDGFTGIYGAARNFVQALRKQLVIWAKKPLFLLPQTYGRYKFPFKRWSVSLIKKATLTYARDEQTAKSIGPFVKSTSDMAFGLPYNKSKYHLNEGVKKIGINVSSLLWDDDTRQRFGLAVDYREFYAKLLDFLINDTEYEIHLISHVVDINHFDAKENDYRVCSFLKDKYSQKVVLAPQFSTAVDAKSYIANMDVFLGSRMHSTIGAISSGVATIPFSYAHKFEALYSNIGYPYIISATKIDTEEALKRTKEWIKNSEVLREEGNKSVALAKSKLSQFEKELQESLKNNIN